MAPSRRRTVSGCLLCVSLALACRSAAPRFQQVGQSARSFEGTVTKRVACRYLLYLPRAYGSEPQRCWPLLLFLHGSGERGDDLSRVKTHGPPKLLDGAGDLPFVVVSPQCREGERWEPDALAALLDEVEGRLRIDADRVCVTGLSMGGRGTWDLAMTYPWRFAAIAPICGGALPDRACRLRNVPVRTFHGARDAVVSLSESETVVEAVRKCGGSAELVVYPEATHDSWTATYADPALWDRLLAQKRTPR